MEILKGTIAVLSASGFLFPLKALADINYGLGLSGGYSNIHSSSDSEIAKTGTTGSAYLGLSVFPQESSVLAITAGIEGFDLSSDSAQRNQKIRLSTGLLGASYRWMFEGPEIGLNVQTNFGSNPQLLTEGVSDKFKVAAYVGPEFGYRWKLEKADVVATVSYLVDLNIADQTNQKFLAGIQYWFKGTVSSSEER